MKLKLTAFSNKPGCNGYPGDVLDVSKENFDYLIGRGAAVPVAGPEVETAAVEPATEPSSQDGAEKATHSAPEKRAKK